MRINISNDEIYLLEPVGKQLKYWFESYNKTYLFKKATLKNDGTLVYNDVTELPAHVIQELQHFLKVYKELEPNKLTIVEHLYSAQFAKQAILQGIDDYEIRFGDKKDTEE